MTAHLTRLTSPWPPFAVLSGAPSPPTFWAAMEARVNAANLGLSAPLALDRAPNGTALPYAEYERDGADQLAANTAAEQTFEGTFSVRAWAASDAQADGLIEAIRKTLKRAPLSFSPGILVYLMPTQPDYAELDPDPGPQGEDVYGASVTFTYTIHRD